MQNSAEKSSIPPDAPNWPGLYDELRALAASYLSRERVGHTLQPTALVHEAFLKFAGLNRCDLSDRPSFLAAAAVFMRQILVDHARGRKSKKRGGGADAQTLPLDTSMVVVKENVEIQELDEALQRLSTIDSSLARLVELRFFGGMTETEAADALSLSRRKVQKDWRAARAWLHRELVA